MSIEIRILGIEGIFSDFSKLGCYITINNDFLDVLTPIDRNDSLIQIPNTGLLRLILKNMGKQDKVIGSVSLQISSLPETGSVWLPLLDSFQTDFLSSTQDSSNSKRILLAINSGDSPIPESLQFSYYGDEIAQRSPQQDSFLSRFQGLQKKIIDLQHNLESQRWQFQREVDSLSHSHRCREESQIIAMEQLHMQLQHQKTIKQDLQSQIGVFKEKINSLERVNQSITKSLQKTTSKYEESLIKHQTVQKDTATSMATLKTQISRLTNTVENLQHDLKLKETNEELLNQTIVILKLKNSSAENLSLKERAEMLEKQLKESESQRENLRSQLDCIQQNSSLLIEKFRFNEKNTFEAESLVLQNQIAELKQQLKQKNFDILDLQTDKTRITRELDKARKSQQKILRELSEELEILQQENHRLRNFSGYTTEVAETDRKQIDQNGANRILQMLKPGIYQFKQKKISVSMNKENIGDQNPSLIDLLDQSLNSSQAPLKCDLSVSPLNLSIQKKEESGRREKSLGNERRGGSAKSKLFHPLRERNYLPMRRGSNYEKKRFKQQKDGLLQDMDREYFKNKIKIY